jgi:LacI family transcriptional regulator
MLARGRRRIGFIGNYETCQSLFERYTAYRYAMLMANDPVEERFCLKAETPGELEDGLSAVTDLPEVFVCAHDMIATEVIYVLRRLGLSVPGDVLVCGFDDSPNSRIMTPTLTTVHIHTGVMASAAIQLLLSRIDEPGLDFRTVHTETELIYRDSTRR